MTPQKTPMKMPMFRFGDQYWIMRPLAVSSMAKVMAQETVSLLVKCNFRWKNRSKSVGRISCGECRSFSDEVTYTSKSNP